MAHYGIELINLEPIALSQTECAEITPTISYWASELETIILMNLERIICIPKSGEIAEASSLYSVITATYQKKSTNSDEEFVLH